MLKGTSVTAEIRVAQRGLGGQKVQLQVEDAGRVAPVAGDHAARRRRVGGGARAPHRLRSRAPHLPLPHRAQPGEPIAENNQQDVPVQVADRREKILYFEGEPRFELKFLRRAVAEDKNLQVVCLQRTSQNKFLRLDVDDAEELAGGFPKTREELFRYRGLVLGSVEASFFTADQLRMIAEFVSPARRRPADPGRPALLRRRRIRADAAGRRPARRVRGGPRSRAPFFAEMKVEPTPFGMTHGVTQLAATEEKSAERWKSLPPLPP